jgi:hypothetical protein
MENVIEFRQIWTTHNTRHEGGRATHAAKTLDAEEPYCGTDVSGYFATQGEVRREPLDKLHLYVDCGHCLRGLRRKYPAKTS